MKAVSTLGLRLWTASPQAHLERFRARLFREPSRPWRHAKHAKWNRLGYFLWMLEAAAARAGRSLSFRDRRVLEIGAGPVLGFAPFGLIAGARSFNIVEPVFDDPRPYPEFGREYLRPLFETHGKLTPDCPLASLEALYEALQGVRVFESLSGAQSSEEHDLVISKSCLEHIADLGTALRQTATLSSAASLHVHYVDFTRHRKTGRGGGSLATLYRTAKRESPEALHNGGLINLTRPSELLLHFEQSFADVRWTPLLRLPDEVPSQRERHPDWRDYDDADLSVANGIVVAAEPRSEQPS